VQGNIGHSIAAKLGKHEGIIAENRFPSVDYSTVASGQPWRQEKKPSTTLSPTFCSILSLHFVEDDHNMEHASHKLLQRLLSRLKSDVNPAFTYLRTSISTRTRTSLPKNCLIEYIRAS
jgi:hypothetical protein